MSSVFRLMLVVCLLSAAPCRPFTGYGHPCSVPPRRRRPGPGHPAPVASRWQCARLSGQADSAYYRCPISPSCKACWVGWKPPPQQWWSTCVARAARPPGNRVSKAASAAATPAKCRAKSASKAGNSTDSNRTITNSHPQWLPRHISQGTLLALGGGYYGTMLAGLEQGIQVIPQLAPNGSVVLQISQRYDQPGGAGPGTYPVQRHHPARTARRLAAHGQHYG